MVKKVLYFCLVETAEHLTIKLEVVFLINVHFYNIASSSDTKMGADVKNLSVSLHAPDKI